MNEYMLNCTRKTSPTDDGEMNQNDDTALQTQDFKFRPWRLAVHRTTSSSQSLSTILIFY